MIDIMKHIHKYVPVKEDGQPIPHLFRWGPADQTTCRGCTGCKTSVIRCHRATTGTDAIGRLRGLIPKTEDWHALVTFYQVIGSTCSHVCLVSYGHRYMRLRLY